VWSLRLERVPEVRNVGLCRVGGAFRRRGAPKNLEQPVLGDDLVGVNQERGQEYARLQAPKLNRAAAVPNDLQRPQDPKLHA